MPCWISSCCQACAHSIMALARFVTCPEHPGIRIRGGLNVRTCQMNWMGDLRGVQFFARAGGPFQAQARSYGSRIRQFLHPHEEPLRIVKISSLLLITWNSRIRVKIPSFKLPGGPGGLWPDLVAPPQAAGARKNSDVSTWYAMVFHCNFLRRHASPWRHEIQRAIAQTDSKRRFRGSSMVTRQPDVSDNNPDAC